MGWSRTQVTGAFSLALLVAGMAAIPVGHWLDARGARALMTVGSVLGALLFVAFAAVALPADALRGLGRPGRGDGDGALRAGVRGGRHLVRAPSRPRPHGPDRLRRAGQHLDGPARHLAGPAARVASRGRRARGDPGVHHHSAPRAVAAKRSRGGRPAARRGPGLAGRGPCLRPKRPGPRPAWVCADGRNVLGPHGCARAGQPRDGGHDRPSDPLPDRQGRFRRRVGGRAGAHRPDAAAGRLLFRPIRRHLAWQWTAAALFLMQAAGIAVLSFTTTRAGLAVFACLFGMGNGMATLLRASTLAWLYGPERYGRVSGVVSLVQHSGARGGARDRVGRLGTLGSYERTFCGLIVLLALAAAVVRGRGPDSPLAGCCPADLSVLRTARWRQRRIHGDLQRPVPLHRQLGP